MHKALARASTRTLRAATSWVSPLSFLLASAATLQAERSSAEGPSDRACLLRPQSAQMGDSSSLCTNSYKNGGSNSRGAVFRHQHVPEDLDRVLDFLCRHSPIHKGNNRAHIEQLEEVAALLLQDQTLD